MGTLLEEVGALGVVETAAIAERVTTEVVAVAEGVPIDEESSQRMHEELENLFVTADMYYTESSCEGIVVGDSAKVVPILPQLEWPEAPRVIAVAPTAPPAATQ